mmetsp:Transcript_3626/g.11267  ORF Transcript_3626/g.11267 Transcript_3626/m.11267 type:complete len:852 (+) Transcript_3626:59-2614(+)
MSAGVRVLMVGEKPSIAKSIAHLLAQDFGSTLSSRAGVSSACPVHTFDGMFRGEPAHFVVTSVCGHVYSIDFTSDYNDRSLDPVELFDAPTVRQEANKKLRVCKHLKKEAKNCNILVLWLDCDREGENICFEVMDNTLPWLKKPIGAQCVFRARFSAVTIPDLRRALATLGSPNENEARSVDARQELDLKLGVAMTRFQSRYFEKRYGNLDATLLSYGPCQTPTLGFCVERHDVIVQFQPETFWTVLPTIDFDSRLVKLSWERGRVFDQAVGMYFESVVASEKCARLVSFTSKEQKKPRPIPLNTVAMLRTASAGLGLGPHHAMQIAERLYIQGYISYPRTESSKYPDNFDLHSLVNQQRSSAQWGSLASSLISMGLSQPKAGQDAGDHPPITPARLATPTQLDSDSWRLYEFIARHFLATLSPDCVYEKTKARFHIGSECFQCGGTRVVSPGWTALLPHQMVHDEGILEADAQSGKTFELRNVALTEGKTSPPDYLTESDLIGLMEKHGIGTDASIATHINTICERNYVRVDGNSRKLIPNEIGIALVHGYHKIDPDIVLPDIRSNIEKYVALIADGKATFEEVVEHSLRVFKTKFLYFVNNISKMDELFEVRFQPIEKVAGRNFSRCGKCTRYMKLIPCRPVRLYCANCDETYNLPQGGSIKLYKELTCPLDKFELVLFSKGKSYPLCPYCYNSPPFEDVPTATMACNSCLHPTCRHSLIRNALAPCVEKPDTQCPGTMVFNANSGPKWRAECTSCNALIELPQNAYKINTLTEKCIHCSTTLLRVDFHQKTTPLPDGQTILEACLFCNDLLYSLSCTTHMKRKQQGGGKFRRHHKSKAKMAELRLLRN